jgi:hypothetical protein
LILEATRTTETELTPNETDPTLALLDCSSRARLSMRIVQDTPDRLVIEDKPVILGATLVFFIVLLLGFALVALTTAPWVAFGAVIGAALLGVCLAVFLRRVFVAFDRHAGAVVIRTATLFRQSDRQLSLTDITGAEVETTTSIDDHNSTTRRTLLHRPALRLKDGSPNLALTEIYAGGKSADKVVTAVNDWLSASPRP